MEELITTLILVSVNFALDIKDTVTNQSKAPAYYEVEKSDDLPEVRPLPRHHLHSSRNAYLARNPGSTKTGQSL